MGESTTTQKDRIPHLSLILWPDWNHPIIAHND